MTQLEGAISSLKHELSEVQLSKPVTGRYEKWRDINTASFETADHTPERVALRLLLADTVQSIVIDKKTKLKHFSILITMKSGKELEHHNDGNVMFEQTTSTADKFLASVTPYVVNRVL